MPDFPKALSHIWQTYHRIRRRKSMGFNGPNPIEWPDVRAFVLLTDTRLEPWEVELLESIDDAYLQATLKQTPARQQPGKDNIAAHVDISDGRGVRSLLRSIAGRGKGKKGG